MKRRTSPALTARRLTVSLVWLVSTMQGALIAQSDSISLDPFSDSAHHWYDIHDEEHIVEPVDGQQRYAATDIRHIADNILMYQKANGGWPKNHDMAAILTPAQRVAVHAARDEQNTTFDNGATHAQINYLAEAFSRTRDGRYRDACVRGIRFVLRAQYANGGWPQFYPDRSGYRRYITFNDGAMIGVMNLLRRVVTNDPVYTFVTGGLKDSIQNAYERGLECILTCQIVDKGVLTAWCQQYDERDLRPRPARSFEPASICAGESVDILRFLMEVKNPDQRIISAIRSAIAWYTKTAIHGIRVETIQAPVAEYRYHTTSVDRVVVPDSSAPPIWTRYYELGTWRPMFCNRDGKPVYTLAEVDRERRTGYGWYVEEPRIMMQEYDRWERRVVRRTKKKD